MPKQAAAVIVRRADGKMLAVSRGPGSSQWALPGGKVEAGESFAAAAARELREETGLELQSYREIFRGPSSGDYETATFEGVAAGTPRGSDEGDVAWMTPAELADDKRSPFAANARAAFAAATITCDLGPGDVHAPSAGTNFRPTRTPVTMSTLKSKQRNDLSAEQFADPAERAYPIPDKAHADNAAARLEQQKGSMPAAKYRAIKRRIVAAQKRFGEKKKRTGRGLTMTIQHTDGARTEIRHMSDDAPTVFLFRKIDKEAFLGKPDESGHVWIQLAEAGEWHGHPAGAFKMNAQIFDQIIHNFNAKRNKDAPIDFEHASEMKATDGSIPLLGAPAQGWIHDLKSDGAHLFAYVKWGDLARDYIQTEKYRYISPAIRFNDIDRVTKKPIGAVLRSAGLTNQPFLEGMRPMAASVGAAEAATTEHDAAGFIERAPVQLNLGLNTMCYSANEYMPRIKAALRLPELCSATQCSNMLGNLRDHLDAAGGDHTAQSDGLNLSDYLMPLRSMVNASMGTTWEQVLDTVEDLIDAAIDRHELIDHPGQAPTDADSAQMSDAPALETQNEPTEGTVTMTTTAQPTTPAATTTPAAATAAPAPTATPPEQAGVTAAEFATVTLSLRAAEARATSLEAEVVTLRAEREDRQKADQAKRVDSAFTTWHDKKGLKETDKGAMLVLLRADSAAFESMYPAVQADQQHLLSNLTGGGGMAPTAAGEKPRTAADAPAAQGTVVMSERELTARIMRKQGVPLGVAQNEARRLINLTKRQQQAGAR